MWQFSVPACLFQNDVLPAHRAARIDVWICQDKKSDIPALYRKACLLVSCAVCGVPLQFVRCLSQLQVYSVYSVYSMYSMYSMF